MNSTTSLSSPDLASLASADVIRSVRVASGLENVFDDTLHPRLERLLAHLDKDVVSHDAGRRAAHETIRDWLVDRALMLADRERYPEICEEVIERPLFATGLPRSGTTLLQMLLGADPQHRLATWWETRHPSPPPGIAPANDPRIARTDQEILDMIAVDPTLLVSHPYYDDGSLAAAECEALAALDLRVLRRTLTYRIPGIIDIDLDDDRVAMYEFHKKVLQALQWKMPKRRWALKGVSHHAHLEALKTVYPDAMVVWVHRDPQKVFPSIMQLVCNLIEAEAGHEIDRKYWGRRLLEGQLAVMRKAIASPMADHPDVYHVKYGEMSANHLAATEQIYRHFDLPFPQASADAVRAWYTASRSDRHGKFAYSLADFGITPEELAAETKFYRDRFDIPKEG